MVKKIVKKIVGKKKEGAVCINVGNQNYIKPSKLGKVLVEVSARHVHLSRKDVEKLFGKGFVLTKFKDLSQPGQFACNEKVTLVNGDRKMENVRILGPERPQTQIELSKTDCLSLGFGGSVPLRLSGDLEGTPGIEIVGPKGKVKLLSGVIVAERHIHLNPDEAKVFGVRNGQMINVSISGDRELVFKKVNVRVNPNFMCAMHIDTDEGNASCVNFIGEGKILK